MVATGMKAGWWPGQDALRKEVRRVTTLLRSIQDPRAHAVGQWDVGEVAMHLSQIWMGLPSLARQDLSWVHEKAPSVGGFAGDWLIRDMWELDEATILGVKSDPERRSRRAGQPHRGPSG
ncbi:MAG TPA: hypothetical protein VNA67_03500 [Pseudonocardiaceae bacterium]|nr:hypothetical protein [Pseudonocardiaceae bacterium]